MDNKIFVVIVALFFYNGYAKVPQINFELNADNLFESVIGHKPDYSKLTSHFIPELDNDTGIVEFITESVANENRMIAKKLDLTLGNTQKPFIPELYDRRLTTESIHDYYDNDYDSINETKKEEYPEYLEDKEESKVNGTKKVKKTRTKEEIKRKIKTMEIERVINEFHNAIPDFDRGEDDPDVVTRRFESISARRLQNQEPYDLSKNENILRKKKKHKVARIRRRNIWRNRTISIMEHFIYATRYKLVNYQRLRKKYQNSNRYRIGYCFGLLYQLKKQQMLMWTQLKIHQFSISTIHTHMRMYEKTVRLDIDIRDVIKHIKQLDRNRKLKLDPNYYDEYYADETTTPNDTVVLTTPEPNPEMQEEMVPEK